MKHWMQGLGTLGATLLVAGGATAALSAGALSLGPVGLPVAAAGLAFALNLGAWSVASALRSERFYDLVGTATYLSVTALCLAVAGRAGALGPRGLVVAALVAVWAVRLGSFLVRRIRRDGKDGRFDALKTHPGRFLVPWSLQGLWVTLTLAAALVVWSRPEAGPALAWTDLLGAAVWAAGFGIEVSADRQKARFKQHPANAGRFIDTGWWAWSRHPNYFGEITLWVGVFLLSLPTLSGWTWLAAISPAFVALLLTRISGVPLLEQRADARWGGQPAYEAYKARTPVLIPRPPGA